MTEIINQIPGYENGRVKRISASELSAPIIVSEIAIDLRDKWNTKVLCLSLDERKELIESFVMNNGTHANAIETIVLNQKNPEVSVVIKKASALIHRKFVRAVIISGAERLKLKQPSSDEKEIIDRWLERMAKAERIPLVLVETV
jgi:hypothetical protein